MVQRLVGNRWFSFINLLLVILSGIVWVLIPRLGLWLTLIALLPNGLRLLGGQSFVRRTPLDWLVLIFLLTAWVGYWAAYDKADAWIKVWLIVTSVLLYFALCAHPIQNFGQLSFISFCLAFSISIYYFLANDFAINSGRVAYWWMQTRPQIDLPDIHHGSISGLLFITSVIASYWLWEFWQQRFSHLNTVIRMIVISASGVIVWAFILTMSRGIWAAVACGAGVWVVWQITTSDRFRRKTGVNTLFPVLTLIFLGAIVAYVYLGPARAGGNTTQNVYGTNTRAELQGRGAYFLADYPITGGGLNSFPGLYSQYMVLIPFFYFGNSYNLFLDIGIEQGITGGVVVLLLYLGSIWGIALTLAKFPSRQIRFIGWLSLLTLIVTAVHGLFYDYLYQGVFTVLLLCPVGFSMIGILNAKEVEDENIQVMERPLFLEKSNIYKVMYLLLLGIVVTIGFNINRIKSIWYANLGAVQMSQIELEDYPTNKWIGTEILPALAPAEISLRTALQYNPANPSANYRLGMVSMLHQDYGSAVVYLETARERMHNHRGLIKSLGYSYVWLGEMEKAQVFLAQIPEAQEELGVYAWWWETQGRSDLSKMAVLALKTLNPPAQQSGLK